MMTFTVPATLKIVMHFMWCLCCLQGDSKVNQHMCCPSFSKLISDTPQNLSSTPPLSFLAHPDLVPFHHHITVPTFFSATFILSEESSCLCKPEGILLSPQTSQVIPGQKGPRTEVWTFPCCHWPAYFEHPAKVVKPVAPIWRGFSNATCDTTRDRVKMQSQYSQRRWRVGLGSCSSNKVPRWCNTAGPWTTLWEESTTIALSYTEKLQVGGTAERGKVGPWDRPAAGGPQSGGKWGVTSRMEEEPEPWCTGASWGSGDILPRGDPEDAGRGPGRTGGATGTPCWALMLTRPHLLPGWWASDLSVTTTNNLLPTRGLSRWTLLPPFACSSTRSLMLWPAALYPTAVPHVVPPLWHPMPVGFDRGFRWG